MELQSSVSASEYINQIKLKKSVTAIHCKPSNKVTFVQWKLINVCLLHAYENLQRKGRHKIHINDLNGYFEYTGNNFHLFSEAFKGLQTTLFTWNAFGELIEANEKESWIRVPFLSEVIWDSCSREFAYAFGTGISQQFYIPKYYASFLLSMQNKFSGTFGLRLYEIGMRYLNSPNGSRRYSVNDLKGLLAVQDNEYVDFKYFNRALKKGVEEVNTVSDINMSMEYFRSNRKVKEIKFYILRNADLESKNGLASDEGTMLDLRKIFLEEFNWKPIDSLDGFLSNYSSERVYRAIEYVRNTDFYKQHKEEKNKEILGAYLRKAIVNEYKSNRVEREKSRRLKETLENLRSVADTAINLYEKKCKKIIDEKLKYLLLDSGENSFYDFFEKKYPDVIQESTEYAKAVSLGKQPAYYRDTPLYQSKFSTYLVEEKGLRENLPDFDSFIKTLDHKTIKHNWDNIINLVEQNSLNIKLPTKFTVAL